MIKRKVEIIRNHCERVNQIIVMKLRVRIFCSLISILSFFMLWRNLKNSHIHCLCEGDSETKNNQASDNQNQMASGSASAKKSEAELTGSVRVLCWIMTSPDNHKTRVGAHLIFYLLAPLSEQCSSGEVVQ